VDVDIDVDVDVRTDPVVVEPTVVVAPAVVVTEPTVVVRESTVVAGLPPPPRRLLEGHRWEAQIAFDGMAFAAGDLEGEVVGLSLGFARQLGWLRLGLEYTAAKVYATRDLYTADGWWDGWEDVNGEMQRFGITGRFRAAIDATVHDPSAPGAAAGVFAEAGVGAQQFRWEIGGRDSRNDVMLGAGVEIAFGGRRMGGMDFGGRMLITDGKNGTRDLAGVIHVGLLIGL
jgi:hypothetical protein